jgi:hypothetical protein
LAVHFHKRSQLLGNVGGQRLFELWWQILKWILK